MFSLLGETAGSRVPERAGYEVDVARIKVGLMTISVG
jgi:hypothetical protein